MDDAKLKELQEAVAAKLAIKPLDQIEYHQPNFPRYFEQAPIKLKDLLEDLCDHLGLNPEMFTLHLAATPEEKQFLEGKDILSFQLPENDANKGIIILLAQREDYNHKFLLSMVAGELVYLRALFDGLAIPEGEEGLAMHDLAIIHAGFGKLRKQSFEALGLKPFHVLSDRQVATYLPEGEKDKKRKDAADLKQFTYAEEDFKSGDYEKGIERMVSLALQLGGAKLQADAFNNAGLYSLYLNEWEQALGFFQKALAVDDSFHSVRDHMAFAHLMQNRLSQAEELLKQLEDKKDLNEAFHSRNKALLALLKGNGSAAAEHLEATKEANDAIEDLAYLAGHSGLAWAEDLEDHAAPWRQHLSQLLEKS